jgi:hypothetical protein
MYESAEFFNQELSKLKVKKEGRKEGRKKI